MIDDSIKIHDKFQLEIKLSYLLIDEYWSDFFVETYIFLPGSLGVNNFSYSGLDFYKDVKSLVRFRAPEFNFGELLFDEESPLLRLESYLTKDISNVSFEECEYDIKMLCNISRRTFKNGLNWLKHQNDLPFFMAIKDFYKDAVKLEKAFRKINSQVESSELPEKFKKLFALADEYLCIMFQNYTYYILEEFKDTVLKEDVKLKKKLLRFIASEVKRAKVRGYPSVAKHNSDNEQLFFRKSTFRKYFTSPLFLKPKYNKESERIQQIIFSLSAGLAMVFALFLGFIGKISHISNTGSTVMVMLVAGYIFKDRVKDLLRIYISQKVLAKMYDHKWNLFTSNSKEQLGYIKEMFYFIKEKNIPKLIQKIRDSEAIIELSDESVKQRVIYYKKHLRLKSNLKEAAFHGYSLNRMSDIIRLNVRSYIRNMDREDKELFILTEGDYEKIKGDRVYHINLVLKVSHKNRVIYRRVRVIITQNGIKRVEPIDIEEFLI